VLVKVIPSTFFINDPNGANTSLRMLLPWLTNLENFIGTIEISFDVFQLLAQSAGPKLLGTVC